METASRDSISSIAESDSEQESLDKVYARIVPERDGGQANRTNTHIGEDGVSSQEDDKYSGEDIKVKSGIKIDERDRIPNVKVKGSRGRIKVGTVINNAGTIHGDVQASSKYKVELHLCASKKNKISVIVSAVIIVVVIIVVVTSH